ncbi:MAG: 50S ribosomal protein L28 [Planctomycetota bacterium]|jgi:large subunit ribosomal protein L28
MARVCEITGRRTRVGNSLARRGLAKAKGGVGIKTTGVTRRKFKPNTQTKRVFVPETGQWVRVKMSAKGLKQITRDGAYKVLVGAGLIKPLKNKKKKAKAAPAAG